MDLIVFLFLAVLLVSLMSSAMFSAIALDFGFRPSETTESPGATLYPAATDTQ